MGNLEKLDYHSKGYMKKKKKLGVERARTYQHICAGSDSLELKFKVLYRREETFLGSQLETLAFLLQRVYMAYGICKGEKREQMGEGGREGERTGTIGE